MNTPLNTPQRHGSVPLAHSTPTTLDLSSAVGSHTHLIEQAASAATLPAWPQGRGETGRLAFIQSIPNGWTTEQQNSVANYLTASSITQLARDLRAVAVNPKGGTETQVGSPTDKMLAADIVNGGPLPAVLKEECMTYAGNGYKK